MAICHVLIEVEHEDGLDPDLLIPQFEASKHLKSFEVLEVSTPHADFGTPYIGY